MRRWSTLLVALLYLLPQAGLLAHHAEEIEVHCGDCEDRGPAVECAGDDCGKPDHHHHGHDHHHPGNCRTCSATAAAEAAPAPVDAVVASLPLPAHSVSVPPGAAPLLRRPIRAPPTRV
jgi:hypothetical protein